MFSQRNNPYCELLSDYKYTKLKVICNTVNRKGNSERKDKFKIVTNRYKR